MNSTGLDTRTIKGPVDYSKLDHAKDIIKQAIELHDMQNPLYKKGFNAGRKEALKAVCRLMNEMGIDAEFSKKIDDMAELL